MNYDRDSFLAGLSVGRTLKGWATAGTGGSGGGGGATTLPGEIAGIVLPPPMPLIVTFNEVGG